MRLNIDRLKRIGSILSKRQSHAFMSHELLVPFANKTSHPRAGMFTKQITQARDPIHPESPHVASGFENEIGRYGTGYLQAQKTYKVIKKICKFPNMPNMKYILILQDTGGKYHVVERQHVGQLSGDYCHAMDNSYIDSLQPNSTIKQGDIVYKGTAYDENMNFSQGRNGRTLYAGALGCFEDAIIIRRSWAEQFTTLYNHKVSGSCNTNELFVNLYGSRNITKSWPDIGEKVINGRLFATRKINTENMYFDLSLDNLNRLIYNDDEKYTKGVLADIDIYCNSSLEAIQKSNNAQLVYYYTNQQRYYNEIKKELGRIIKRNPNYYTDELSRMYDRAYELTCGKKITVDGSEFEHLHVVFHVVEEKSIHEGGKLAGRFGDKGVVSVIWDDEYMPKDEYGNPVDVILSMIGPINRLNSGQFDTHYLGFMQENICRVCQTLPNLKAQTDYILKYLSMASPSDHALLTKIWKASSVVEIQTDLQDIFTNGLKLHQAPFWGNLSFLDAMKLDRYYNFPRYKCTYNSGVPMSKSVMIGPRHWYWLYHTPEAKSATRSTGMLNQLNMPDKSKDFKKNRIRLSNTPQRQGEMENMALLMANDPMPIVHMTRTYASDPRDRENLNRSTIGGDPFNINVEVDFERPTSGNQVLTTYFKGMGHDFVKGPNPPTPISKSLQKHFDKYGI